MILAIVGIVVVAIAGVMLLWAAERSFWRAFEVVPMELPSGILPTMQIHDTIGLV